MERLKQIAARITQPIGESYCQKVLGIKPEFPELDPIALTLLHLSSLIHVLKHKSIIEGYPLPTEVPAIITGNHRAEGDSAKLYIAARKSQRLIRAVIKRGLVEKEFKESNEFHKSIGAEDEDLPYNSLTAFVLKRIGTYSIDREHIDRSFLHETDQILQSQILGLFLQSHRYKDGALKFLQTGAAVLIRRHPDIPVFLFASSGKPDGPDKLTILESFTYAQLQAEYGKKLSAGELTVIMADRIAEALPDGPKNNWFTSGREIELQRLKVSF